MNKLSTMLLIVIFTLSNTTLAATDSKTKQPNKVVELELKVKKLERHVKKLEKKLSSKLFIETIGRLDDLQTEIREIRGDVESIDYKVRSSNKRNTNYFIDTDRRLNEIERSGKTLTKAPVAKSDNKLDIFVDESKFEAKPILSITPKEAEGVDKTAKIVKNVPQVKPVVTEPVVVKPVVIPVPVIVAAPIVKPVIVKSTQSSKLDPNERKDYMESFNYLKKGRYKKSLKAFSYFLKKYPNGRYADNAQYWLAESNYVSRFYDVAIKEFTKVIEMYPASPKVSDARLKLGYCYYESKEWNKAKESFEGILRDYPNTSISRLAERRLKRIIREGH